MDETQTHSEDSRVLAIGLDSMDRDWVDRLIASGDLPNLARIREGGAWAELSSLPHSLAETSQVLGITGCSPDRTGYWSQNRFHPDSLTIESPVLYDFERQPPFFALGENVPAVIFDLPQLEFHPEVHGIQVAGWGAHSPMSELRSAPAEIAETIVAGHGRHPAAGHGFAMIDDPDSMEEFRDRLERGIDMRRRVVSELVETKPWRLFFTWISETHQSGHYFWPHEDLCMGNEAGKAIVEETYRRTDEAIGEWMERAGPEASVVVYSLEGFKSNTDEFPSIVLLAEWALARRFGEGALEFDPEKIPISPEKEAGISDWVMELWNQRKSLHPTQKWLRNRFPPQTAAKLDRYFGGPRAFQPEQFGFLSYQHVMWVSPYWPMMPVFALPSFSDGFLRINVKGREKPGIIPPSKFDRFCEEVIEDLHALRCADTGVPVVEKVIRMRTHPQDAPESPADLVVVWADPCPKHWETPWGRMSRGVSNRAGSHRPLGFLGAIGPGIPSGKTVSGGDVRDVAPTILGRISCRPKTELEGTDLLS